MLIKACAEKDVYSFVGSLMYNRPIKKSDLERQEAKIFTLAVGYRSGINRLSRESRLSGKRCVEIRDIIWNTFPRMKDYGQQAEYFANHSPGNYIATLTGRRRYFNNKSRIYTEAVNTVVQGSSLDMFKIALADIYKNLTNMKLSSTIDNRSRIWHVMHDEVVIQTHQKRCRKSGRNGL